MNKIPIKIDLSLFFNDERRKVLLMYKPEWKTVECLQRRVETLFDLEPVRFLSDDGCFLPPQESIEVIKFSSSLKAFIHNDTINKKKSKKERKRRTSISDSGGEAIIEKVCSNDSEAEVSQKKRKYRSLEIGFASSTPNRAKRIRNDVSLNATEVHRPQHANKSSEISSTSEQMPPPLQPLNTNSYSITTKKSKKKQSNVSPSPTAANGSNEERTTSIEHISSKGDLLNDFDLKHSHALAEAKSINENTEATTPPLRSISMPSSTFVKASKTIEKKKMSSNTNPFKNPIPNSKHLHFDESGEITTTTATSRIPDKKDVEEETKVVFHCALNDDDAKKPRIFQIQSNQLGPKTCTKADIEIQENIIITPENVQSILNKSQIFDAPSQAEMDDTKPDKSLLLSPDNSMQHIDNTNFKNLEDHSSPDETNCSLNDSNDTASTATDKHKGTAMDVSIKLRANETDGDESTNIQTNQIKDDDVSMNQTSISEENKLKDVNESSVLSVDCVDLSIDLDDDDDCKSEPNSKKYKKPQDVSNYDSSDVEEVSEIIDLNETEEAGNSSSSFDSKSKYMGIKLSKILSFCTNMTQMPEIGDVVVFKIPYVSRKGSMCVTDYFAGETQYINRRTKSIKILILDGHLELCNVPDKFFSNLDSSMCDQKIVQIKFTDMIEPKIWRKK